MVTDDLAEKLGGGLFAVQEVLVAAIGVELPAIHDFGVPLEGVEVRVTEHLLHQANVAPCDLEQGGGGRMPRDVRGFE